MEFNDQFSYLNDQINQLSSFRNELIMGEIIVHDDHSKVGEGSGVIVLTNGERFHFYIMRGEVNFVTADNSMHETLNNAIGNRIQQIMNLAKQRNNLLNDMFEM